MKTVKDRQKKIRYRSKNTKYKSELYIYVYTSLQLHTQLTYTVHQKVLTKVKPCKSAGPGSNEIWPEA